MSAAPTASTRLNVLLAEDNPVNQLFAARIVQRQGHEVQVVSDGQQALNLLVHQSFDVVLMDVNMPVMDGFEAVRALRQHELRSGTHVPVIAISASGSPSERAACFAIGMDDFVGKPIREAELVAAISRIHQTCPERHPVCENEHKVNSKASCDLDAARTELGGDEAFLEQLIQLFLETVPNQLQSLSQAMVAMDRILISDLAHSVKGAVRYFLAESVYNAGLNLELVSRTAATGQVQRAHEQLICEIRTLQADLQSRQFRPQQSLTAFGAN